MIALTIQTILLFAIAFILGCVTGCLLRSLFGSSDAREEQPVSQQANSPSATVAAVSSTSEKSPVMPEPPMPVTPVAPAEPAVVETPPAAFAGSGSTEKQEKPKPVAKPKKAAAADTPKPKKTVQPAAQPDNLKLIRGIGPQNEARLNALGVNSFAQIANWSRNDQAHYGEVFSFPGRIEREEWVPQAKVLARGGKTDFSKRVSQGTVKSSADGSKPADLGKKPESLLSEARDGKADNLTLIDGVGNALEQKLFKLGIHHFDQIAAMSDQELKWLGNELGFPGRPERENWAGESKILASGGTTDHAQKVERGQIKTSRKSDE